MKTLKIIDMKTIGQLEPDSILFLKGDLNYTQFNLCDGRKYLSSNTLKIHEDYFTGFLRISRSFLLNPLYIAKVELIFGEPAIIMTDGTRVKVPRRKISQLDCVKLQ